MRTNWKSIVLAISCVALVASGCQQKPQHNHAADEAAIRAVNPEWFKAYNAGDVNSLVALYAEDGVVCPPGAPASRGHAAMREYFPKDVAGSAAAGITLSSGSSSDVGVSGDLGWESGTFTATDKSGATVDAGKFVTLLERRGGKWLIIRDIWNSDAPPPPPTGK